MTNITPTYTQLLDWYYQQLRQQPIQPMVQQPAQMQAPTQQSQDGDFIVLSSEQEALKYPVALGKTLTFKIENQPLLIEKTMGFSKLDSPQIKYYDIHERKENNLMQETPTADYASKSDIEAVISSITGIREEIQAISKRLTEIQEDDGV